MLFLFLALWIILSGRVTAEIVVLGVLIMLPVYWFMCRFFEWNPEKELKYWKGIFWSIRYVFVLLTEIVKANLEVMRLILSAKVVVEPKLKEFNVELKENSSRVLLANSITLTPGTITVKADSKHYLVHALDSDLLSGIEDSVFVKLLKKREEKNRLSEQKGKEKKS